MNKLTKLIGQKKWLLAGIIVGMIFFALPVSAQAAHTPRVYHRVDPVVEQPVIHRGQTSRIRVYTQGHGIDIDTPVCAINFTTGEHLGCVPGVDYSHSQTFDFNVERSYIWPGTHFIGFTYRDHSGIWREILSFDHTLSRARVVVQ